MPAKLKKIFIFAGIIAPLYLFLLITLIGPFWQGYDFIKEYVSVLGSGSSPYNFVVNFLGFSLFGLVLIGFAFALQTQISTDKISKSATILLVFGGLMVFLLSIFKNSRYAQIGIENMIHRITSLTSFIVIPASMIFYGISFKKDRAGGKLLGWISILLGILAALATFVILVNPDSGYAGLVERLGIGAVFLWVFLTAVKFLLDNKLLEIEQGQ